MIFTEKNTKQILQSFIFHLIWLNIVPNKKLSVCCYALRINTIVFCSFFGFKNQKSLFDRKKYDHENCVCVFYVCVCLFDVCV